MVAWKNKLLVEKSHMEINESRWGGGPEKIKLCTRATGELFLTLLCEDLQQE